MMQKVIALYEEEAKNEAAYNAAEAANDQAAMEAARSQHKEHCRIAQENGKDFCFMLRLYTSMKERGNVVVDLDDVHDYQAAEVMEILRKFGVEKFTFSSTWSSAISAAWEISQHGYILDGMILINGQTKDFSSDEWKKVPALVFTAIK